MIFDLTDNPGRDPSAFWLRLPSPRAVGVAAYRSRDTKSQGERFADRARYGLLYCALNTATHPCTPAGVPAGGAVESLFAGKGR